MSETSRSGPAEKEQWWRPIEPITLLPWAFTNNIRPKSNHTPLPPRPAPTGHGYARVATLPTLTNTAD